MSVTPSQLVFIGSANMPDADGATVGGAPDGTKLINFSDLSANGLVDYFCSAAGDTGLTLTTTYRDASGVLTTEAKSPAQAGTAGTATMERMMKGVVSGGNATGDLAILAHTATLTGTAQAGAAASATADATITLAAGTGASTLVGQIVRCTNNTPSGVQYQLRRIVAISGDVASVNRDWGTVPSSATTYTVNRGMLFDYSATTGARVVENRRPFYGAGRISRAAPTNTMSKRFSR